MTNPPRLDRTLLGPHGHALSDNDYAQVVAGLGVLPPNAASPSDGEWSSSEFQKARLGLGEAPTAGQLLTYRDRWIAVRGGAIRLAVRVGSEADDALDPTDVLPILNHTATQVAAILRIQSANADFRWQWPIRVGAFRDDFDSLELTRLRDVWPSKTLVVVEKLSREQSRCDVLIVRGNVRDALRRVLSLPHAARAGHIILITPPDARWRDVRTHVDTLLYETQAAGLSMVTLPPERRAWEAFNDWVTVLSHNEPFDVALVKVFGAQTSLNAVDPRLVAAAALTSAARRVGDRLRALPPSTPLSVPPEAPGRISSGWTRAKPPAELGEELVRRADDLPFHAESTGASAISEISTAEREATRSVARDEPPRYLQGDMFLLSGGAEIPETRGLVVGEAYALDVLIGERGLAAVVAETAVPLETLDWTRDSHTLQVMFAEPGQWDEPQLGTLKVKRTGPSSTCRFTFSPVRPGPFAGRITVFYRGRVLQSALWETVIATTRGELDGLHTEPMRLRVEALIRRSMATLDDRRRFDACVVLNHTATRQAAMTAAGKDGAFLGSLDTVKPQLAAISALLTDVANNAKPHATGLTSPKNAALLVNLAIHGRGLYGKLVLDYINRSSAADALKKSEFLQIVSMEPDALVPLEFVYEYPPPAKDAPVCPNAKKALADGVCPATCVPKSSPAPVVCPLGFWGLRKVIERHVHVPTLGGAAKVVSEPVKGRDTLSLTGRTLLAISEQVPKAESTRLGKGLSTAWKPGVVRVAKWTEWTKAVTEEKPILIVALPHSGGAGQNITLEIGGDTLASIYIDDTYVWIDKSGTPPIAILLGCDTGAAADPAAYASHVEAFRRADAALVLGTIATVLGASAAPMAGRLVGYLAGAAKTHPGRFGEILRTAKRQAVADSQMIALCLVAFGDADWQLTS